MPGIVDGLQEEGEEKINNIVRTAPLLAGNEGQISIIEKRIDAIEDWLHSVLSDPENYDSGRFDEIWKRTLSESAQDAVPYIMDEIFMEASEVWVIAEKIKQAEFISSIFDALGDDDSPGKGNSGGPGFDEGPLTGSAGNPGLDLSGKGFGFDYISGSPSEFSW